MTHVLRFRTPSLLPAGWGGGFPTRASWQASTATCDILSGHRLPDGETW